MKRAGWFTCPAVTLAVVGLAVPQVRAADPSRLPQPASPVSPAAAPQTTAIADVALAGGGILRGQVLDPQGTPLANREIVIRQQDRTVATSRSDRDGRFAVSGLSGGVYQIATTDSQAVYRLWAPGTAPPAAQPGALVVAGGELVRGQAGNRVRAFFTSPWVLAGLLGAAIATPIALSNHDKISTS